jgi:hypothetical protein
MKTTSNYSFPKEYFKYVNRFLKEVGLYPYWIKFLYFNPKRDTVGEFNSAHTIWLEENQLYCKKFSVVNVLGKTNFTDFLKTCYGKRLPDNTCSYELFAAFLSHFYPSLLEYEDLGALEKGDPYLIVNKETKKVSIQWE